MLARLSIVAGPDKGMLIPLTAGPPLRIGRGDQAHIRLQDPFVSRHHCQFLIRNGRVVVVDGNSTSGTFVNGVRVREYTLQAGDIVAIGDTRLCLQGEAPQAVEATLAPDLPGAGRGLQPRSAPRARTPVPERPAVAPPAPPPPRRLPGGLPRERMTELTGKTLGHFDVGPLLGRGRTGLVFRARDRRMNQEVALKVLWPELATDAVQIKRFVRSAKTALPLRHPNLVALFGAGKTGPYLWIAMEHVAGESLTHFIQRSGVADRLDWRRVLRIAIQLTRALQFAHERHVLHRNLTPQNVLIRTMDRTAKLGDLLLAKPLQGLLAGQLTQAGEMIGDFPYLAPEQLEGSKNVDERADLYSLGALLYALLTGHPPFEGATPVATLLAIQSSKPEPPRTYQMALGEAFQGIVLSLLAKRPENRPSSATRLLADLEQVRKFHSLEEA